MKGLAFCTNYNYYFFLTLRMLGIFSALYSVHTVRNFYCKHTNYSWKSQARFGAIIYLMLFTLQLNLFNSCTLNILLRQKHALPDIEWTLTQISDRKTAAVSFSKSKIWFQTSRYPHKLFFWTPPQYMPVTAFSLFQMHFQKSGVRKQLNYKKTKKKQLKLQIIC